MSDDKAEATYYDPTGESAQARPVPLPQREPLETFARHGAPPASPYHHAPVINLAPAPWGSPVHPAPRPSSTVAVWALVLGCIGILAGWCMFGLPCIAAVVLGHVGLSQTKDGRTSGRGMAVAGLVLGYVALVPAIVLFFWLVLGAAAGTVAPAPSSSF